MKKLFFGFSSVAVSLAVLSGCGDKGSAKKNTGAASPNLQLSSDESFAEGMSQDQLIDVAAAAGSDNDSSTEQLQLELAGAKNNDKGKPIRKTDRSKPLADRFEQFKSGFNPKGLGNGFGRTRSCVVSGSKAVVTISGESEKNKEVSRKNTSMANSAINEYELVRTWEWEGKDVGCSENQKFAAVDFGAADLKGLKLSESVTKLRAREGSITNKNGKGRSFSFSSSVKGTREIVWVDAVANIEISPQPLIRKKQITSSFERSFSSKNSKGEVVSAVSSSKISAENPIVVSVVRAAGTKQLQSRLIESGTIADSLKDGSRLETSFDKVLLVASETENCPIYKSGSVTSKVFEKDATTPKVISVITFTEGEATIKLGDAEAKDYNIPECDDEDADRKN
jgi:hypothetical protein